MIKRTAIFVLFLSIVFTSIPFAFAKDTLSFLVASDTHYQCSSDLALLDGAENAQFTYGLSEEYKNLYYYASTQGQMHYESAAIMHSFLDEFIASEEDILLIAGDLTCGKRASHIEFSDLLKETEKKSGKRIFVINGNHDCDDDNFEKNISVDEFKTIYSDFGYSEANRVHENSASYSVDLSPEYTLIAIDSCIYGKDEGAINRSVFSFVKEEIAKAKAEGKAVIAMMHHSILPHFKLQSMISQYKILANYFADNGVSLVFTGHIHANDISEQTSLQGNSIYDIQTGALISAPNAYRKVTLDGNKAKIESKYITSVDEEYLTANYTPAQLDALKSDFSGYAYGYLEAGLGKWLNRYIGSPYKVAKLLKAKEGTKLYEFLDGVMSDLAQAVHLDIYQNANNESIEGIAKKANVTIPKSEYNKVYELAAKFMFGFYHGDEENYCSEEDRNLLLYCIKSVVAYALYNLDDSILDSVLSQVCKQKLDEIKLTAYSKAMYIDKGANILSKLILESLADGILSDYSYPEDVNVTIDLSNNADKSIIAVLSSFIEFIKNVINKYFSLIGGCC